jgi:hypothetical protein
MLIDCAHMPRVETATATSRVRVMRNCCMIVPLTGITEEYFIFFV